MYTECRPPEALAASVECFWTNTPGPDTVHRVMPDGAIDIVLTFVGEDLTSATVVGTMTTALVVPPSMVRYVGVRFLPGAAPALLGVPASELTDRRIALDDVWPGVEPRDLASLLLRRPVAPPPPDIAAAVRAIRQSRGVLAVAALGPALGVSRQQLARRFAQAVGVTPKTFARIVRMQAVMRRAAARPDWSGLAYELGYADQSHLVNDFRTLTGLTPGDWFQNSKTRQAAPVSIGV
ncbi:MAG TPA: helix-turn-helix domain-containing protein [Gemmatimonadaceae bacterium]|jgi:AraC-like DNA-binding protein|nr:helix-turn-helix domain-containing protein [Gemmatimonadaceae bacterium]